ncbi:hypothetical protein CK203_001355 [Vitis vinifera]|uniref:Uncharacterized protein n=1 Tax=Vitis vinifera TaxID=29760 RepID=A0A438KL37_VITVI|nr:hypothetical protein CK203_001355 [Vitis vinifera]
MMGRVSRDWTGRVVSSAVRSPITRSWAQSGAMHPLSPTANPKESRGVGGPGLKSGVMGLKMKGVAASEISPEAGPSHRLDEGPSSSAAQDHNNSQKKDLLLMGLAPGNTHVPEPFVARETEDMRKLNGVARISETDKALEEESMRGVFRSFWGWNEEARADNTMWLTVYEGCNERSNGCKELGANKSNSDKGRGMFGVGDIYDTQTERGEQEGKWEESGLAKFSQFLVSPRRDWRRKS